MKSKHRILSGVLSLVVLVSVICLGMTSAYGRDNLSNLANPSLVRRGRYLVTGVTHCADCHSAGKTPNDPSWLSGYRLGSPEGAFPIAPNTTVYASNLTPDQETGIGSWTPQQVFASLRHGQDNEGKTLCPPMPWDYLRSLTDRDTWAIVAYLKNGIKPVNNPVPENIGPGGMPPDFAPLYEGLKPLPAYPGANER
ncbi:c-type cytochrome [Phormidesmis sp. 146-35]